MKDHLIFPALVAGCVIAIYFESKLFVIILAVLLIRIIQLKNLRLLLLILLVATTFLIRCQWVNSSPPKPSQINSGIFAPDVVNVNGDLLSGEMKTKTQTVRFIYRIPSKRTQLKWQNQAEIVVAPVVVQKITRIDGPRNPGEFNFQRYTAHKNIHYTVELKQIGSESVFQPQTILDKINVLRIHIIQYLRKLPKWLRIHAQSLIIGYTENSDKNFLKLLSVLGVIHLFSLSGLHVLILLTLLRKLTSTIKLPLEWVDTAILVLLPCYGMLVGSKSGIWRAIVLAMVEISLHKLELSYSRLDVFSITIMICLLIYPFGIMEMGGQLSFLLSFAILYLYRGTKFLTTVFKMNLVSLPLICFYTYQFNLLTLLVNVIFIPFFTYFILPVTLFSALTVNWSIWKMVNQFFEQFYSCLDTVANDSNFTFVTGSLPILIVVLLVVLVLFLVESKSVWNRYLVSYLLIFSCCILLNKVPLFGSVNLIDVGQGDSIVVTTPFRRKTFLIDVGGKLHFPTPEWAKRVSSDQVDTSTIPFLKSRGISQIDKIFLSHKDVDHIGNLETILSKFTVKEVDFGTGLENNTRIKQAQKLHPQIKFQPLQQGNVVDTGSIKWHVLWPHLKSIGENGDSLTLLARINQKNWLFPGDLDDQGEQAILKDHHFKVDYLKVGHHGSRTSTSEELLEQTKPKFGFISAGINNRYGHPNIETLQRLQKYHVQYFNTADYGMITWYYFSYNNEEKITTFLKGDLLENNGIKKRFTTR